MKRVTTFGATTPRWAPDGGRVVFESTREGQSEIYAIDTGTNVVQRVPFDPAADVRASWSRDRRFIYFSSNRTGRQQITREGGAYAVEMWAAIVLRDGGPARVDPNGSGKRGRRTPSD